MCPSAPIVSSLASRFLKREFFYPIALAVSDDRRFVAFSKSRGWAVLVIEAHSGNELRTLVYHHNWNLQLPSEQQEYYARLLQSEDLKSLRVQHSISRKRRTHPYL